MLIVGDRKGTNLADRRALLQAIRLAGGDEERTGTISYLYCECAACGEEANAVLKVKELAVINKFCLNLIIPQKTSETLKLKTAATN